MIKILYIVTKAGLGRIFDNFLRTSKIPVVSYIISLIYSLKIKLIASSIPQYLWTEICEILKVLKNKWRFFIFIAFLLKTISWAYLAKLGLKLIFYLFAL